MDCLGDIGVILFRLKGHFGDQKEWFKTILGPVSVIFCCYYSSLPWPDPSAGPKIRYNQDFFITCHDMKSAKLTYPIH